MTARFDGDAASPGRRGRVAGVRHRSRGGARGGRHPRLRGDRLVRAPGACGATRRARLPSATSTTSAASTRFARPSSGGRSSCSSADVRNPPHAGDGADRIAIPTRLIADSCLDLPVRMLEANQLYEELLGHVPLGTTDCGLVPLHHASALSTHVAALEARASTWRTRPGWRSSCCRWSAIAAVAIKLTDGGPGVLSAAAGRRARAGVRDHQAPDDGAGRGGAAARSGPRRATSA